MLRQIFLISLLLLASGCSTLSYYSQAIGGHLSLMFNSRPVEEVVQDPRTPGPVREHLRQTQEILAFARSEMALETGDSYTSFVRVPGRYVVWNVVAAEEFSIEAKQWCYPFAGCVGYRGYYHHEDAEALAAELTAEGLDTTVSGAAAYSTLGWLDDPIYSSMLYKDEARLVEVLIHELAHRRLYIKGDMQFNESFASVVAREGVRRWFEQRKQPQAYQAFLRDGAIDQAFNELLLETRKQLAELYAGEKEADRLREKKQALLEQMQSNYRQLKAQHKLDGRYDDWMSRPMNNARLALVAAYHQREPELMALLERLGGDMKRFYAEAPKLVDTTLAVR